jgi:hypothetical protein
MPTFNLLGCLFSTAGIFVPIIEPDCAAGIRMAACLNHRLSGRGRDTSRQALAENQAAW